MANWQTPSRLSTGSSMVSSQNFISGMTKKPKVPERTYTSRPRPEVGQDPSLGPALGVGSSVVPNRGNVWSRNQTMPGKDPALNGLAQAQQSVTPPAGRTIFGMDSNKFARFAGSMGAAIAPGTGGGRLGAAVAGIAQDNIEKDYKSQELKNRQDFLERGRKATQESTERLQEKRFKKEEETTKSKREHEANLLKDQIARDKDKRDLDLKLKKAQIKNLGKEKTTTLISNYNAAVANGYKGTLAEWKAVGKKGVSDKKLSVSDGFKITEDIENRSLHSKGWRDDGTGGLVGEDGAAIPQSEINKVKTQARKDAGTVKKLMNEGYGQEDAETLVKRKNDAEYKTKIMTSYKKISAIKDKKAQEKALSKLADNDYKIVKNLMAIQANKDAKESAELNRPRVSVTTRLKAEDQKLGISNKRVSTPLVTTGPTAKKIGKSILEGTGKAIQSLGKLDRKIKGLPGFKNFDERIKTGQ